MKLILILLGILILPTHVFANNILFLKGDVFKNGKTLKKTDLVKYDDLISTKDDSMAIIKVDNSTIKIRSNSEVVIKKYSYKGKKDLVSFFLKRGEVFFKGKKNKDSRYRVRTKMAVMGVRGTEFFTTYSGDKNKEVWMCVNEGQVKVNMIVDGKLQKNKALLVNKGEGIFINSSKLPKKRAYKWTRKLNWNMGKDAKNIKYDEVKENVDLKNVAYPLEDIDYD